MDASDSPRRLFGCLANSPWGKRRHHTHPGLNAAAVFADDRRGESADRGARRGRYWRAAPRSMEVVTQSQHLAALTTAALFEDWVARAVPTGKHCDPIPDSEASVVDA